MPDDLYGIGIHASAQAAIRTARGEATPAQRSNLRTIQRAHGSSDPSSKRSDRTPGQEVVAGSQGEFPYGPEVTAQRGNRDSSAAMESAMEIQPLRPYGTAGRASPASKPVAKPQAPTGLELLND